jgi:hypothetical protein
VPICAGTIRSMSSRTGVVWIAGDVGLNRLTVFSGYWGNDGESALLEQMPEFGSAVEAIRWGLERSDDVRIRFDGYSYWWAGVGTMPDDPDGVLVGSVVLRD